MVAVEKNLNEVDSFLDGKLTSADQHIFTAIKNLEKKVVSLASKIETDKNGNIRGPKWTLKQAQRIHARLVTEFEDTFGAAVKAEVAGYDDIAAFIKKDFTAWQVPMAFSAVDKNVMAQLKKQSFQDFEQLGVQAQNRIAQALYDGVLGGQSMGQHHRRPGGPHGRQGTASEHVCRNLCPGRPDELLRHGSSPEGPGRRAGTLRLLRRRDP